MERETHIRRQMRDRDRGTHEREIDWYKALNLERETEVQGQMRERDRGTQTLTWRERE